MMSARMLGTGCCLSGALVRAWWRWNRNAPWAVCCGFYSAATRMLRWFPGPAAGLRLHPPPDVQQHLLAGDNENLLFLRHDKKVKILEIILG